MTARLHEEMTGRDLAGAKAALRSELWSGYCSHASRDPRALTARGGTRSRRIERCARMGSWCDCSRLRDSGRFGHRLG